MGRPMHDLTGMVFGKLTVEYHAATRLKPKAIIWHCQCACGNTKLVFAGNLKSGQARSCGCERLARCKAAAAKRKFSPNMPLDLRGMKFGRWSPLESFPGKRGGLDWLCQCECGTTRIVSGPNLRSGKSRSCGCYQREVTRSHHRVHRMAGHPIYNSWAGMRDRCLNPNTREWEHYGGRGIKICKRWDKFMNFLVDMFATWEPGLTLDRIEVNGDYEPSNCRWADYSTQNGNRRSRSEIERQRRKK